MTLVEKVRRFRGSDERERAVWFRQVIQSRMGRLVFGAMRAVVNRGWSPFQLTYRPDSDFAFGALPALAQHRADWIRGNADNNLGDLARLYSLVLNVQQVMKDGVPGDFAELGVYKGNSAKVLADLARASGRHLVLFDTFAGFDDRDLRGVDARTIRGKFSDTSLERVQAFVGTEGVSYEVGYFPDSVTKEAAARQYAVVHLDCDLYAPTRAALRFFYPRLAPGGLLLIHDYSAGGWDGLTKAVDEFLPSIPERLVLLPDKSGTAVLRRQVGGV